jgi:hypothetical protein
MILRTACLLLCLAPAAAAQQAALDPRRPFEISDNSFLVEEAFNQEAGIFQNILLIQHPGAGAWSFEFTQEWPLGGQRHQLSYTVPIEAVRPAGAGDYDVARGTIALNYRYQLSTEAGGGPATSPRLSVLIPRNEISDQWGVQFNFPLSKQFANLYLHANAGLTVDGIASDNSDARWHTAASLIYRAWPMVHLMVESVYRANEHETATGREDGWLVSPGVRAGFNLGDHQLVLGVAVPIGLLNDNDTQDFIAYISYELPFMRR